MDRLGVEKEWYVEILPVRSLVRILRILPALVNFIFADTVQERTRSVWQVAEGFVVFGKWIFRDRREVLRYKIAQPGRPSAVIYLI